MEFQTAGDCQKAVALSGEEVGGKKVKIAAAAPPAGKAILLDKHPISIH